MTGIIQDFRFAARTLRKQPMFAAVAILTLALGIGANSAVFTLINTALLRPLPFREPDRLALIWEATNMFGVKDSPSALANYADWRARSRSFEDMGALEGVSFRLTGRGETRMLEGSIATASLFHTLGVQPMLGRLFSKEDDQPGAPKTALLSYGAWRREFGGVAGIVGGAIDLNDEKYTVIGVMPPSFRFPDGENNIWAPLGTRYQAGEFANRGRHNFMVAARLKPGVSMAAANQEIAALARQLEQEYPNTNRDVGAFAAPLRDHFVSDSRPLLLVLGGAVGFVLLIACANIANLLLSRASNRKREIAIRAALGAGRGQVVRQLFTENLLLAGAGGVCGLLLAVWGVRLLAKLMPDGVATFSDVTVDGRALAFTLGVSVLTALLFGLAPAFQLLKVDLNHTLKLGGSKQGTRGGGRTMERCLVVAEVALAFVLAIGAGLLIQSFARLRAVDPGFRTANILTLRTLPAGRQYRDPARRQEFYERVLERVTAMPGVVSAGYTLGLPLAMKGWMNGVQVEGKADLGRGEFNNANYRAVTPEYLQTIGVPLRDGRFLERRDADGAPLTALVNEAMKRKFWPDENPVGKRFRFGGNRPWITVVGLVGDIRQTGLDAPVKPETYVPVAQAQNTISSLAIRTQGDPVALASAVRTAVHEVDPGTPILEVKTMEEVVDREVYPRRAQMLLLSVFAALALTLASTGIYGVLAYLVARRTQEIGVRMALGARPVDLLRVVAGEGFILSLTGVALGALAALCLTRLLEKLLYGVKPTDPATFAAVAALLLLVAAAASCIPARRAARIDPILALREE
jgi:putative ABC transport system permease protein